MFQIKERADTRYKKWETRQIKKVHYSALLYANVVACCFLHQQNSIKEGNP